MQISARNLEGAALNYAVAIADGVNPNRLIKTKSYGDLLCVYTDDEKRYYTHVSYITDLSNKGMRIVEHELISVINWEDDGPLKWRASCPNHENFKSEVAYGPTFLIAAMRAYVWSKLGEYVEIPDVFVKD